MWIITGILAGLTAGIIMGICSQLGYRLGIVKSHLIVIDGAFVLRIMKQDSSTTATYVVGTIIHLATSVIFGIVYAVIARAAGFAMQQAVFVLIYVFVLWLAMLVVALPVAGQGIAGSKIRSSVWLEQLVLHVIFGLGFWWALGIV